LAVALFVAADAGSQSQDTFNLDVGRFQESAETLSKIEEGKKNRPPPLLF